MKWTRKTQYGENKPYISEDGHYKVADMSFYDPKWFDENGKRGYWWAVIEVSSGSETILKHSFKTAKAAKEYVEHLLEG